NTTINTGGSMIIFSGGRNVPSGVANNTTINTGGSMLFYSGGVANNTTINTGGSMLFYSGGVANSTTISSGGRMEISGGVANSTTINTGGRMDISSGGVASDIWLLTGGRLYNDSGILKEIRWSGGGITNSRGPIAIESRVVFSGNKTALTGGAIDNAGTMTIYSRTVFSENMASSGGAVANSGNMSIGILADFSKNMASSGGAVYNNKGTLTVNSSALFLENTARRNGGAIYNCDGSAIIGNSAMFSGNAASYTGGAIYNDIFGAVTLGDDAVFSGNAAKRTGGAIYNSDGNITIGRKAVFSENMASYTGGAIYQEDGVLNIGDDAVFSGNKAIVGGAIYNDVYGKVVLGDAAFATTTDTVHNSGTMVINGDVSFAGNVTLEGYYAKLENNGNIDFNISDRQQKNGVLLNDWSYVSGEGTYSITIDIMQAAGTYQLIGNVENFDQTITVRNDIGLKEGTLSLDMEKPLNIWSMSLNLEYDEETKVLSVVVNKADKIAPTLTVKKKISSNCTDIILSATADESGSTIEYSVNKQTWITGSSAVVNSNQTIYWRATDAAGNVSEITSCLVNDFVTVGSAKASSGLKIGSGKIMKVLFGGTANQITVSSGGVMNVAGKANYTSAFKGAAVNISKGGSMFGVNLYSGAELNISSGGTVNALTFNGKGTAYVYSGGQLTSTTVNSSGTLAVYNGAKVTSATLKNGGTMNYYGGTVYNVELLYGGSMTIESSAVRKGQIANKGTIIVSSGGKASGCIMKDGGAMKVLSGGSADDTKLMTNGIIYVYSSGNVTDTVTSYGARVYVSGGKIYNTNMQRGTITSVYQGGMASLNKVDYGSYLMVGSGATSYDTVVSSGGGLTVMSGAKAGKNTVYGTLTCNNSGTLLGVTVIHGRANLAGNAVVTDETSITFDVSERSASAMQESYREAMLNSYYVAREADMTISVAADQASGSYILANWALEAKKGTFTLEVDGTEVGTFSTTKSLTYNGKTYSLYCFDDATNSKALTLKVSNATARDAWTDLGSGDFDGDGIEESLVSDGTNLYATSEDLWLGNLSATEEIASITDYNNDGTDDLLIHNTATDQMTAWLIKDGATYSTLAIA
ncbi:MAG: AIDA repeat-containing protein, partial [Lentisphaeria bacterium]|nr:AIDA repeat-containing protein [Lentisphaeria bacterium]